MSLAAAIGHHAIHRVVEAFYQRIRTHATLAGPFAEVPDWPLHQERLVHFWWVALGGERERSFQYQVATKHFVHGFTRALLDDWILLFGQTLREQLPAPQADGWLALARRMGEGLANANDRIHARDQENPHAPFDFAHSGTYPVR